MKNILILLLLLICTFFACKTESDNFTPDYGFDYYPLEVGLVRHFEVDSIFFSTDEPRYDTSRAQIREILTNLLENNTGDTLFRVERSKRIGTTNNWEVSDIYTEQIDFNNIFRREEDIRQLKLALPPTLNKTWDGNAEIPNDKSVSVAGENIEMFKDWDYRILSVDETVELDGKTYENVITVQLADNDTDIEYRYGIEKYAKGIGLIYRELRILDTQCKACCNAPDGTIPLECVLLPWEERADEGFILIQKIIEI